MFRLDRVASDDHGSTNIEWRCNLPHPFADGKPLQGEVLWELENKITDIEDRSQPD